MVLLMPTKDELRPHERRILDVIEAEGREWVTRGRIAQLIGRPARIHPGDIAALDKLTLLGLLEVREGQRGATGVRMEYRIRQDE